MNLCSSVTKSDFLNRELGYIISVKAYLKKKLPYKFNKVSQIWQWGQDIGRLLNTSAAPVAYFVFSKAFWLENIKTRAK